MKLRFLLLSLLLATSSLYADGTITTPGNVTPVSWKIASIQMVNGAGPDLPSITIGIYYFDAGSNIVSTASIALTSAEFSSFFTTTNSAVAGESGSAVKRYRQRVSKWLIDNGKITNVTPE